MKYNQYPTVDALQLTDLIALSRVDYGPGTFFTASIETITQHVTALLMLGGLSPKSSCRVATTANLAAAYDNGSSGIGATLENDDDLGALSIDGENLVLGDRVLVKDQATPAHNGIYTVTTVGDVSTKWVLTRATDYDNSPSGQISYGTYTVIFAGATNMGKFFMMTTMSPVSIGATSISFILYNLIKKGDGIDLDGNTINVDMSYINANAQLPSTEKVTGLDTALGGKVADTGDNLSGIYQNPLSGVFINFDTGAAGLGLTQARVYRNVVTNSGTTRTFIIDDTYNVILFTNTGGDSTATIPTNAAAAIPIGANIKIINRSGTRLLTLNASGGVTLTSNMGSLVVGNDGQIEILKIATDTWIVLSITEDYTAQINWTYGGFSNGNNKNIYITRNGRDVSLTVYEFNMNGGAATGNFIATSAVPERFRPANTDSVGLYAPIWIYTEPAVAYQWASIGVDGSSGELRIRTEVNGDFSSITRAIMRRQCISYNCGI